MIIHTDIMRFYQDVIEHEEYKYLFKDLVVIDVGCNVGMFSLWILELADRIYAIDIAKENIDNLNQTIKESRIDKIKTYHIGIADKTGNRSIEKTGTAGEGGWRLNENGTEEVNVYSLRDFMDKEKIVKADIVKVDIEGMERNIFTSDFPKGRVKTIIGEYHFDDRDTIIKALENLGYLVTWPVGDLFIAR